MMFRTLRIEYSDAYYHVMNRGAGGKYIFNNEQERFLFLEIISESHRQYDLEIHESKDLTPSSLGLVK